MPRFLEAYGVDMEAALEVLGGGLAGSTVLARKGASVRVFMAWAVREGHLDQDPSLRLTSPQRTGTLPDSSVEMPVADAPPVRDFFAPLAAPGVRLSAARDGDGSIAEIDAGGDVTGVFDNSQWIGRIIRQDHAELESPGDQPKLASGGVLYATPGSLK